MKEKDVVFDILNLLLSASPERSYQRLSPSLRSVLNRCIDSDLPFQPDTFHHIYTNLRGSRWFGDGAGSHVGEGYYTQACKVKHASACQSFEQFAGRPGVLWEENVQTAERLHVGAHFSWKGHYVEITSMRRDSLVACTYKDSRTERRRLRIGATIGEYDELYVITSCRREGKALLIQAIKSPATRGDREVAKRFTVSYDEIAAFRRTERTRIKLVLSKIATCNPEKDAERLSKHISDQNFRHFQLEEIRTAFNKRKDWVASEKRIEAWRNGAGGAWLDVKNTLLRVKDNNVECSNGNSVGLAAVRRALPIVMARRQTPGDISLPLDGYTVKSVGPRAVVVGCTHVPWPEVELLAVTLKIA